MLTIAVLVMILGLIMYFLPLPTPAKVNEVGRIMFQVGLFFFLAAVGGQVLRL